MNDEKSQELTNSVLLTETKLSYRLTNFRWVALGFACFLMVGSYFSYDNPGALQNSMQNTMGLSIGQVNWFYSIYSFPNMILPFFGGVIIDRIGVRVGVFVFSSILIVGQSIFCYGAYINSFYVMLLGRLVFGFGGESLSVSQSTIVAQWFHDKELAFAMGFNISVARLGSALNSALSPTLAQDTGDVWVPIMVGIFLCIASCLSGLVLNYMDKVSDEREGRKELAKVEDKISWEDVKSFSGMYWLLVLDCVLIYGAYFSFTNNANDIMVKRFGFSTDRAGLLLTIIFIIAAVVTPIFGKIVDLVGKRALLMQFSITLLIFAHFIITFMEDSASPNYLIILPLIMMGIFYATYAAVIWPCYPLVVEEKTLGTAFGIVTACQNAMLVVAPLLVGVIHDKSESKGFGYFYTEIFLAGTAISGWICNFVINIADKKRGKVLNGLRKIDETTRPRRSSILQS